MEDSYITSDHIQSGIVKQIGTEVVDYSDQNNLHRECIEDIGDIPDDNIEEDNMYMDCGSSKANEEYVF
ncbi:hypothetical protein L1887_34294 [Cichorium endivia]|nr:hypothetical protein L1887_34294 [Cichorium endivia]